MDEKTQQWLLLGVGVYLILTKVWMPYQQQQAALQAAALQAGREAQSQNFLSGLADMASDVADKGFSAFASPAGQQLTGAIAGAWE